MARQLNPAIREFILQNVATYPDSITSLAAHAFGLTRQGIGRYLTRLTEDGLLTAQGNTRARRYALKPIIDELFILDRNGLWNEDTVWRERIFPLMAGVKQNIINICQYGFTEILNNVLDHSGSPDAVIGYMQNYTTIEMTIRDHGVGIFNKIKHDFGLPDVRTALLELSKGKLTSDRRHHAGEGIYFTSRMFDKFSILSDTLFYSRIRRDADDWLLESADKEQDGLKGTFITMRINTNADWTTKSVFEQFQGDDIYFRKTHVPVALGRYPGEQLVSRSQAKRILARFSEFSEVILDFNGVAEIGQPFADEIFRVFRNAHPDIPVFAVNTNEDIDRIIRHVQGGTATGAFGDL
jgi:anti-sigma regulatory factor (Ser/Thr protein kinase)